MAVAFDAETVGDGAGGAISINHTPVATPRGLIALVKYDTLTGDVTYGGQVMALVGGNALAGTGGMDLAAYFLGSSIPTGTQTLANANATGARVAIISLTAGADTELRNFADISTSSTGAITSTIAAGTDAFIAELWASTAGTLGATSPLAGWTQIAEEDEGSITTGKYRRDALGSGSVPFGINSNSQTVAVRAIAVGEVASAGSFNAAWARGSNVMLGA